MNRKGVQIFAAGWFFAACIVCIYYFIFAPNTSAEPKNTSYQNAEKHSIQQMEEQEIITFLEAEGFTVLHNKEAEKLEQNKEPQQKEDSNDFPTHAVLHIEEGMNSNDAVSLLHQLNIIENIDTFKKELQNSEAATNIQAGFYKVNSDMTEKEIITKITK
ncbi:hypothetical protein [Alteribacillus bidgolensis]|uniref:YceG-like family protein n=1 Tax=Alteribacillus bidgolensis TaxID=930129 RepID=A0A1G8P3H7_9BACI|nr:hypothetical protein [Alteribacillus bidgolensis]SDI87049.1 hypothetical protein SAMN05216352_113105 [Alteribacillus bidgolensis]